MTNNELTEKKAILRSSAEPSEEQKKRFLTFLSKAYHQEMELVWEKDEALSNGFRLQVGDAVYDWSLESRIRQFRERLSQLDPGQERIIPLMKDAAASWTPEIYSEEVGKVISVGDEIATVKGLDHATYGEILLFDNGVKGMVMDL